MINFFRLVLAGLVLAMAGLIAAVVTMRLAIHGAEVKVPDLQGLTVTEAVHKTANMGLNLGIDNRYYSVDVPAGRVLAQSPLPGAIVRREWRMRVTESLGPQRVAIPKVVGQQERVAAIEVRRVGLELEETAQMPYSGAQPGTVIAQNPQQGAGGVERPSVSLLVSTPAPVAGHGDGYAAADWYAAGGRGSSGCARGLEARPGAEQLLGRAACSWRGRGHGSSRHRGPCGHGVEPDPHRWLSRRTRNDQSRKGRPVEKLSSSEISTLAVRATKRCVTL